MNYLSQLDTNLFFLINHLPHNLILDYFFGAVSFIGKAGAVWFILSFLFFFGKWKKLVVVWGTGILAILLALILKEIFGRVRPEFVLQNVILPFGPDTSFSFPSGHALLSFTFAYLLTKYYPKLDHKTKLSEARSGKLEAGNGNGKTEMGIPFQKISFAEKLCLLQNPVSHFPHLTSGSIFYLLAILISFSRIYLGYHYPLDAVGGAVIGIIVAKIALRVLAIRK